MSASSASNFWFRIISSTPLLSCRWPGIRANLTRLPSASHRANILVLSPRASALWPGFESCALAVTVHFHDRGIGHGVLHIRRVADGIKEFLPDMALPPSRKRLKTVLHLPNSSGQSRQGLPVHTIHGTASTNKRLSVPLGPASPGLPRQCGAISAHCLSLNTLLSMAGLQHKREFSTGPRLVTY